MPSVQKPRRGVAEPKLDPFDEMLLGLIEAGCQYIRDHPEARSEIRRAVLVPMRRLIHELDDEGER
jgi:hypothetical protein